LWGFRSARADARDINARINIVCNDYTAQETIHKGDAVFCYLHPDDIVIVKRDD